MVVTLEGEAAIPEGFVPSTATMSQLVDVAQMRHVMSRRWGSRSSLPQSKTSLLRSAAYPAFTEETVKHRP